MSMKTANNGSILSNNSNSKESLWQSTQSSPISSSSNYNNINGTHLNSVWDTKLNINGNANVENESLGSIWMIPQNQSNKLMQNNHTWEAPLPPPSTYSEKFTQLLRPQEIGGSVWSGASSSNNNNNSNHNNLMNSITQTKMKDPVGALWAQPTPPNLPMTLQAQNYNLLTTNNKYMPQQTQQQHHQQQQLNKMRISPITTSLLNNAGNLLNGQTNLMGQQTMTPSIGANNGCNDLQLLSPEFLSYLNMIN